MNPNIAQIRKDFPILSTIVNDKKLVYLDNAATTQKPIQVINKLTDYYKNTNANVHRGVHTLSGKATDEFEDVRIKVAKFINVPNFKQLNPIIWTRNTTESINIVSMTWANDNLEENDAGPIYGFNFRNYGANYINCKTNYTNKGFDQLEYVINLLGVKDIKKVSLKVINQKVAIREQEKIDEYGFCLKEVKQLQKISDYELDTLEYGEYEYQEVELPQEILDAAYAV